MKKILISLSVLISVNSFSQRFIAETLTGTTFNSGVTSSSMTSTIGTGTLKVNSFFQEIVTLSIKARLVQYLAPFVKHNDDTAFINLFDKWKVKFMVASPPSGTTQVSVDSIPIGVVAACYSKVLSAPQGSTSVGDDFKADVATLRAGNPSLDNLLDAIDQAFSNELAEQRLRGRRLLTGKNN